jgi:hypothetical protein
MRPMPDQPQLIYLEPDDEITSVVRRLRAADGSSVVIVVPGRSRATSSAVALRLLAQVAAEEKRSLTLVADAATRAVAGEAGIAAFASVAEATSGSAVPDQVSATPRAPIHVVRGLPEGTAPPGALRVAPTERPGAADETMAVRLAPTPGAGGPGRGPRRRFWVPRWPLLAGLLLLALIAGAALLPGATVSITPATQAIAPTAYQLQLPIAGHLSDNLHVTVPGMATGTRSELVPATGSVTFSNWNNAAAVAVPQGTSVSVGGGIAFATSERIVIPAATFSGNSTLVPSKGSVGVTAVASGVTGNVGAGAIDTIDDRTVRGFLRGSPSNKNRLVTNPEVTIGGLETPHTVVQQSDVDAVVAAIQAALASHLAGALTGQPGTVYAGAPATELPIIDVPADLVGKEDTPTFELTGTLAFDRPYVMRTDVEAAALAKLRDDAAAVPDGTSVVADSIKVEIGTATENGPKMTVAVSVTASAAAAIDEVAVRDKVAGMTKDQAEAALADRGQVKIDLWPGWLDRLPRISFRISVKTVAPAPAASPSP